MGIEVIPLQDWAGFSQADFEVCDRYTEEIVQLREARQPYFSEDNYLATSMDDPELDQASDMYKKATPEAEAFLIVKDEREGRYHMVSERQQLSPSWFISDTSILNLLDKESRSITWQPEAFLKFVSTLSFVAEEQSAEQAFQTILWGCAQSGLSLLDEKTITHVMGGLIDETSISILEQREAYEENLGSKYGEPIESVLSSIKPMNRPLAAIQLAHEITQKQEYRRQQAEQLTAAATKRAIAAERKLAEVEKFRVQMDARKAKSKRNARKQRAKQSSKKRK